MATTLPAHSPPEVSEEVFARIWQIPPGVWGQLSTVQNTPVGMRFIYTAFLFFVLGGINALLMRIQLASPENTFLDSETYNRIFTMHGSTMMFLFSIPLIQGLGMLVLPQMLGARELPFPRLSAFSYWTFLFGGLMFYSSFLFNEVPNGGWFAYVPLTSEEFSPNRGMDFWLLGLNVAEIGALAGAFELVISFFTMRAPGMTLNRVPIFAWALLVTAFMMIFAFTPLIVGSLMLEFDRKLGTHFYDPTRGGSALLWQHIFWIFGHPDVYIQFIPPIGIVSTIIPVFARRTLVGYPLIVAALVSIGFLSFGLWVHHMFATGLPELSLSFFTAASMMIAIPSGIQVFAWLATLWGGRPAFKTPFLFVLGFFAIFVLGGLTGVMLAVVPFNLQAHDSYFVVAHFHYVMIGGMLFPIFGGIYYWAPKFIEKMLNERLGQLNFWLMFVGFNITFFPMHISGLLGMPRRVYTYQAGLGWDDFNILSTIGAFILGAGFLVFVVNYFYSLHYGEDAPPNPWDADTLEWATPTPMPQYGFRRLPIVRSRYPLWEQESLQEGQEKTQELVDDLTDWPLTWRGQITTSALDAEPREVFRVAGPSIYPLVVSAGVMFGSYFLVFDMLLPTAVSVVITIAGLIGWHWQDLGKVTHHSLDDEAFEQKHGIPVRASGSFIVSRMTMWLTIVALSVALATLLFSYFYLRLDVPQWPPADISLPNQFLPAFAIVLLVIIPILMRWAGQPNVMHWTSQPSHSDQEKQRYRSVLGGVAFLSGVAIAIQTYDLSQQQFTHQSSAYGSIFFTLAIFQMLLVLILFGMSFLQALLAWDHEHTEQRLAGFRDITLYAIFLAVASVIIGLTLYVFPRVA